MRINVTFNQMDTLPVSFGEVADRLDVDIKNGSGGGSANLEPVSVTPTESTQTILPEMGVDGFSKVDVAAIPSDYVGSGVTRDPQMTASGKTVTAPAGYYTQAQTKNVADGSATTPTGGITADPTISVSSDGLITASVSKSESITPIVSEGYVTAGTAGTVTFAGSKTSQLSTVSGQTITPTESVQTAVPSQKFTTGDVKVGAIPSDYVGSAVPQNDSSDLTVSGATVTAPSGYYANNASATVASGSATTPATTITANPSVSVDANGLITASVSASQSVTPTVSEGYVSAGTAGTVSVSGSGTSQLDTQAAVTVTPTTAEQTIVPAGKFTTGAVKVSAMPNGVRGNRVDRIGYASPNKKTYTIEYPDATSGYYPGSTVANPGTIELTRETSTVTPSTSSQTVTPTSSLYYLESVTVDPIPPQYIVPSGTYTVSASGTADITNYADLSVPSGSAGSPALSVSEVTDHAVTVRASTIRTAGWIPSGTVQGASRNISASDLVSGTKSITSNGTGIDVTNYATVDVSVSGTTPNLQTKTGINPSTSSQTISADVGYDGLDSVQINAMPSGSVALPTALSSSGGATVTSNNTEIALNKTMLMTATVNTPGYISSIPSGNVDVTLRATDANFLAENIKSGVTLFGKTGSYTGGGGTLSYDTKTVTASNYPVSLEFTGMKGEPKAFVVRLNAQVSSSGSTTYYYIVDISHFGTTTHGNCFRIGSTRRVDNITSGYSYTYSGTTLTITSSAASRSASPGAFYSGSYELMYAY